MATIARIRSCSVGSRPVVGSGVTSPTVKTPNCMRVLPGRRFKIQLILPGNAGSVQAIPVADPGSVPDAGAGTTGGGRR
ncbi:hypothetical protein GCM10027570_11410 [Streptomonospora sediminis]